MKAVRNTFLLRWFVILTCLFLLLPCAAIISAQDTALLIAVGQNQAGTLADTPLEYNLSAETAQRITVQILAITAELAPRFRVLDENGIVIAEATNDAGASIVEGSATLSTAGSYTIAVSSANDTTGDFLISVQAGDALAPPEPLVLGELQNGMVDSETTREVYSFSASSTDVLWLTVLALDPVTTGMTIALSDTDNGELHALSDAQFGGVRYRILSGITNYLLEVSSPGDEEAQSYSICLETENGAVTCANGEVNATPVVVQPVPTGNTATVSPASTTGACVVQSGGAASVNVRSGAGINFGVVTQLLLGNSAPVLGRLADNSWYQVNVGGVIGWVSSGVVILSGNCTGINVVVPPPVPTQAAPQPTATWTPDPTNSVPTNTPSAPTSTPNATPIMGEPPLGSPLDLEEAEPQPDPSNNRLDYIVTHFSAGQYASLDFRGYIVQFEVANIGNPSLPYPSHVVRICVDTECEDRAMAGGSGGPGGGGYILPGEWAGRTATVTIYIDINNDINESDETNNLYRAQVYFEPW